MCSKELGDKIKMLVMCKKKLKNRTRKMPQSSKIFTFCYATQLIMITIHFHVTWTYRQLPLLIKQWPWAKGKHLRINVVRFLQAGCQLVLRNKYITTYDVIAVPADWRKCFLKSFVLDDILIQTVNSDIHHLISSTHYTDNSFRNFTLCYTVLLE